jgi:hypothetical protein
MLLKTKPIITIVLCLDRPDSLDVRSWRRFALGFDNNVGQLSPTVMENGMALMAS